MNLFNGRVVYVYVPRRKIKKKEPRYLLWVLMYLFNQNKENKQIECE